MYLHSNQPWGWSQKQIGRHKGKHYTSCQILVDLAETLLISNMQKMKGKKK